MSFSRANALGWAMFEVLTSTQMNALDIDHANAVDGAAGGAYSPSSVIDIDHFAGRVQAGQQFDIDATGLQRILANGTFQVLQDGIFQILDGAVATFAAPLTPGAKGRVRWRLYSYLTDGPETVGPEDANVVWLDDGILSGNTTLSIDDTGSGVGDWMLIASFETTSSLQVSVSTTGVIATLRAASGQTHAVLLYQFGSLWKVIMAVVVP